MTEQPLYKWLTADSRTAIQNTPWPVAERECSAARERVVKALRLGESNE